MNIAIAIVIGLQYGMVGLVVGEVIVSYVNLLINVLYSKVLLEYTFLEQLRDILPTMVLSVIMGLGVHFLYGALDVHMLLALGLCGAAGGLAYLLLHRVIRTEELRLITGTVLPRAWKLISDRK